MIGIQSSIIMFPINLLIVSIFRNTRPRERDTKTVSSKRAKAGQVSPPRDSNTEKQIKDITPDTVIKVGKTAVLCFFIKSETGAVVTSLFIAWCVVPYIRT